MTVLLVLFLLFILGVILPAGLPMLFLLLVLVRLV